VLLAQVAIPVPLTGAFTYRVPDALAERVVVGVRCLCQFRRRLVVGVVVEVSDTEPPERMNLLSIEDTVDDAPVVPDELLRFLQRVASYYMAPIGEVLLAVLPSFERKRALQRRKGCFHVACTVRAR
jgi:primosomal protein N'